MHTSSDQLDLRFGLSFEDLYRQEGLARLDQTFLEHLQSANPPLAAASAGCQSKPERAGAQAAVRADRRTGAARRGFHRRAVRHIRRSAGAPGASTTRWRRIYALKRKFVQKKAISGVTEEQASAIDGLARGRGAGSAVRRAADRSRASSSTSRGGWMPRRSTSAQLKIAAQYAAWAALSPAGSEKHHHGVLFRVPHKLDMTHLVPVETVAEPTESRRWRCPKHHWRHREGFKLTDAGMDLTGGARSGALLHQVPQPGQG